MDERPAPRDVHLHFCVSREEAARIRERMTEMGIVTLSAYLRKMALDGYHITIDLSTIRELIFLLRNSSNNLNQIARRVNETGSIYAVDIEDVKQNYDALWEAVNQLLNELSKLS